MTYSWFSLSTLNYDARSTTHQIYTIIFNHFLEIFIISVPLCASPFIEPWSKLCSLHVHSCVSPLSVAQRDLKQNNTLKQLTFSPNTEINVIFSTNYRLSCRRLSRHFRLSPLYCAVTGAARRFVFLVIFFIRAPVQFANVFWLHSSTVKTGKKYLNATKFTFFSKALFLLLLLKTFVLVVLAIGCVTSPGHWVCY